MYVPDEERAKAYDVLYAEYQQLHDHFGRGGNDVLHRLRDVRRDAVQRAGRSGPGAAGFDVETTSAALTGEQS